MPLRTLGFSPSRKYFVAGIGIYEKIAINHDEWGNDIYNITTFSINSLRGDSINDVVGARGVGEVLHFNGYRWNSYFSLTSINGNYLSVTIKDNLINSCRAGCTKSSYNNGNQVKKERS